MRSPVLRGHRLLLRRNCGETLIDPVCRTKHEVFYVKGISGSTVIYPACGRTSFSIRAASVGSSIEEYRGSGKACGPVLELKYLGCCRCSWHDQAIGLSVVIRYG